MAVVGGGIAGLSAALELSRAGVDVVVLESAGQVGGKLRGVDGVAEVIEQLAGCPLPASALESLVLPGRVRDYDPSMLDMLMSSG